MVEVKTALEAIEVCDNFRKVISTLPYNQDLKKMLKNIETMVSRLSQLETTCRLTSRKTVLETPLLELNKAINNMDKWLLLAKLLE